jgi:predicted nucleotidyltransferase
MTMITKMELIEGELGRFAMNRGQDSIETYNRLKTLVHQIRNYGSTRWIDHDIVRVMLRLFTVLGRFAMKRGEDSTETYNRLKTLVHQNRNYGSTRWIDHDIVRIMLSLFTVPDPNLVNFICENPRYTKMMPRRFLENL